MACRPIRWLILALATPLLAADCFLTADWDHMVPGLPMVLAWANFHSSFYDILLNRDVKTRASLVGSIARTLTPARQYTVVQTTAYMNLGFITGNVTQSSIVWLPPEDISEGNPNRLFAVQLWDLARGTVCNSPSFNFKPRSPDTPSESVSLTFARLSSRDHNRRPYFTWDILT